MWTLLLSLALAQDDVPSLVELLPDVPSFTTARKRMYEIHADNGVTLYCGCTWTDKVVDLKSCGLGEYDSMRWNRTEAEHVVPASAIGSTRDCWAEGRDYCLKHDAVFRAAHNDLHNLYPAVGQINNYRSNNLIGIVLGDTLEWGTCDFEIDLETDKAEPRPQVRGDIARIHFYVAWMYGVPIPEWQTRLFLWWHQSDPVDAWELERNARIRKIQGNGNPFVEASLAAMSKSDE